MQNENEKDKPKYPVHHRDDLGMTIHLPAEELMAKQTIEEMATQGHKVLIIGSGTIGKTHLLEKLLAAKTGPEKDRLMDQIAALELRPHDIPQDLLTKLKDQGLLVVVDDMSELDKLMHIPPMDRAMVLTNPYQGLHNEDLTYYEDRDPKKKHWDKPKFMGDAAPVTTHRSGGNNRKIKKRKKSKNGRKRK